jgi:lambda family phage tail tape measure protein
MATTVDRYGVEIVTAPAVQALNRLQQKVEDTGKVFQGLNKILGKIAVAGFITGIAKSAKALDDFSKSSGIALQNLMRLTEAVKASGATQDQAIDAFGQFTAKLREASNGGKEAQDAFAKVGITLDDLRTLSNEALLEKAFRGLASTTDDVTRLGAQMGIFGESFRIVDTGATGVASKLGDVSAEAIRSAAATKSAADAYRSMERALSVIRDIVLITLKPVADLVSSFQLNTDIVAGLLKLGAAFYILQKAVLPATTKFYDFAEGILRGKTAQTTLAGGLTTLLGPVRLIGSYMGETANQFKIAFTVWTAQGLTATSKLTIALGALGAAISRLAIAVTVIIGLNEAIKGLTNIDPIDALATKIFELANKYFPAATKAIDDFGVSLGMASMYAQQAEKAANGVTAATEQNTQAVRDVQDALKGEKDALDSLLNSYKLGNKLSNDRFQLETRLIGVGEDQRTKIQELQTAYENYTNERTKLEDQIKAKASSTSATDKKMVGELQAAIEKLTSEYNQQKTRIEDLTEARASAIRTNQLEQFSIDSLVSSNQRLADLQTQIATATMPELAKRYREIEDQARASAQSAIAAEEARRKSTLSEEERNKYLEAAAVKVRELQAAEYELAKAQRERSIIDFGINEKIENERKLRDIAHEINTSVLPERARIEKDLKFQAEQRARAEIDAENARRGTKMSTEEEARYFSAAREGVDSLIAKEQERYDKSRQFNTGWKQAMNDYVSAATNGAEAAKRVFDKTFKGLEDLFINFAKTGKFEWKGFINSILEELVRSELQMTIAKIFGAMKPSGGSSSGNFFGNLFAGFFANGGQIPSGKFGVVGEAGPELISGPANITPMTQVPGVSSAGATNVTYNINAVDARSFQQLVAANPEFIYAVTLKGQRSMPGGR